MKGKFIVASFIVVFIMTSCIRKDINLFVEGGPGIEYRYSPSQDSLWLLYSEIRLEVRTDPAFDSLCVMVNGDTLKGLYDVGEHYAFFQNSIAPEFIQYNLEIESDIGEAIASCRVPEPFKIIKPRQTIQVGEDCEIVWHRAKYAEWYEIHLLIDYLNYYSKDTSFATTDTSVIIKGSWFDYPGLVEIAIIATNGVKLDAEKGNMHGNAIGYWLGKLTVSEGLDIR